VSRVERIKGEGANSMRLGYGRFVNQGTVIVQTHICELWPSMSIIVEEGDDFGFSPLVDNLPIS
jgi:hypothetical protein